MSENHDEDQDRGIIVNASDMTEELVTKKKKRKKRRKPDSQRGLDKPTGFEDNFADPPLTVEQAAELKELYHPDLPFVDRILIAIQRFERTRKLLPERRDVFHKYLAYGGIDVGPNMFQGSVDTKEMDKDEMATAMAQTNISAATKNTILDLKAQSQHPEVQKLGPSKTLMGDHAAKYIVDFPTTMKAFLSRRTPTMFPSDTQDQVTLVTTTLERFMDYLLQQSVCPEYTTEVLATRNLCRHARNELWSCAEAGRLLPGDFNMACSTLFGGQYGANYDGETDWTGDTKPNTQTFVGLTPEKATQIVGFAIAAAATEEVYSSYDEIYHNQQADFRIISSIRDHGFEIKAINPPTSECQLLYKTNTTAFHPVGTIRAEFWFNPDAPPEDLTPHETESGTNHLTRVLESHAAEEMTFFIEFPHLLSVGQRVETTIHKLNCGAWFFDEFRRIYPSFDTWIENEMVMGWKEPRALDADDNGEGGGGNHDAAGAGLDGGENGIGKEIDAVT